MTKSISSWRQMAMAKYDATTEKSFADEAELPLDEVEWERIERKQWLEAARSFDRMATLPEELLVRLVGDSATGSGLRLEWDGLLKPLQEAVATNHGQAALELSGFSKGSSVLHFRAAKRVPMEHASDDLGAVVHETPLAAPLRQFIDVVDAAEHHQDLRAWVSSVSALEKLSGELQRLDLEADFRFCSRSGDVRAARLSRDGMSYLESLSETDEVSQHLAIRGRITELRESGHAKVKTGAARSATAYDVDFDSESLRSMRLVLGEDVDWLINVVSHQDKLGRSQLAKNVFVRDLGRGEQPPLALE